MKFIKGILVFAVVFEMVVILFFYHMKENYRNLYYAEKDELYNSNFRIERYKEKLSQTLFTDNTIVSKAIILTDLNNNKVSLDKVVNTTKLVYRFTYVSCEACVNKDLSILKQLGDSIGFNNIIIITNYKELIQSRAFINQIGIKSSCYNFTGKFNLSIENDTLTQPPFYFLLDNRMKIRFPYKTDDDHSFSSPYFMRIIQYFKTGI